MKKQQFKNGIMWGAGAGLLLFLISWFVKPAREAMAKIAVKDTTETTTVEVTDTTTTDTLARTV